jgi:hypothetical protein
VKEVIYVKKCFTAAAIAIVIINFAEFNTLFVLVTMDLPAYAQRLENTTKLNITSSMADAPSRPSEKQFLPDQDSITVTPGLSTDELNTNTQQDSADIGENDLQGKILELQPEVLDQRSEQNNGLVAKPTSDIETASENLVEEQDEEQDETTGNLATQNEESDNSEQEDRQQTEEQRDESRTAENEADGNSAVSEGQNEQGKEDGDEGKDNGNKDDSDGDEDKDEGDNNNEIPFELPFP